MTFYPMFDPSNLRAGDAPLVHREVTVAEGGAYLRGQLLGRVTASDKYIPCVKTASDGSQNPAAVLAYDTDTTSADVATVAYFEGEFAFEKMIVDASWTSAALLDAAFRQAGLPLFIRSLGTLG
jgi:hypothetical protein